MRWVLPLLALLVGGIHLCLLFYFAGLPFDVALTDSIVNTGILSLSVWGMLLVVNAYPTRVGVIIYAILIGSFFALSAGYASWQAMRLSIGKDDRSYYMWLAKTMPIRYIINVLICGWLATYTAMEKQAEALENKFLKQTDAAVLHKEAELYKLRQQLQPHFLYNSLNSISALTMIAPEKAQDMIGKLSDFLRSSVRREGQEKISILEELGYIEAYLSIESVRFGNRLRVEFEKEYTDDAQIPPFLLQPLLENAIKFGLYGKTGNVTIRVHIALQEDMLHVKITNPFDHDSQPPRGTGFGLEGIRRRLYLLFARTDLLETHKADNTFITTLKIPQHV